MFPPFSHHLTELEPW